MEERHTVKKKAWLGLKRKNKIPEKLRRLDGASTWTLLTALQTYRSMLNLLEEISITAIYNGYPCVYGDLRCKYRFVLMPVQALAKPWPEMKAIIKPG